MGQILTEDARCETELWSRIAVAKQKKNKNIQREIFLSLTNMSIELWKQALLYSTMFLYIAYSIVFLLNMDSNPKKKY